MYGYNQLDKGKITAIRGPDPICVAPSYPLIVSACWWFWFVTCFCFSDCDGSKSAGGLSENFENLLGFASLFLSLDLLRYFLLDLDLDLLPIKDFLILL